METVLKTAVFIVIAYVALKTAKIIVSRIQTVREENKLQKERVERARIINSMSALSEEISRELFVEFINSSVVNEIVSQIRNDCGDNPYRITVGNNFVKAEGMGRSTYYDFLVHSVFPISDTKFICAGKITPDISQYIRWGCGAEDPKNVQFVIRTLTIFAQAIGFLLSGSNRSRYFLDDRANCVSHEKINCDGDIYYLHYYYPDNPVILTLLPTRGI